MQHIVIIGGGFAGVSAGVYLRKYLDHITKNNIQVTVIDKNPYHTFTPSLYEVATSEEPQGNVAIPFTEIFDHQITYLKDGVKQIHANEKMVELVDHKKVPYDYLIIALGSQPAFMHIPGLEENCVTLKSMKDALHIRNMIKSMCCEEGICHRKVNVVVGGGGFSGTEIAAELLTYKDRLAAQHKLDKDCLDITIIQGSDRLLKELDSHVSKIAEKRLSSPYVHFAFGGHIKEVTKTEVKTDNGKAYPYHMLIWTGGVEANHMARTSGLPVNKKGQLTVNSFLQVEGYENIFAAGDIAGYIDPKTQEPVPTVAQVAEEQGEIAAENVIRAIQGKSFEPYNYRHFGYVVPLRGKYATAELMFNIHVDGFPGWVLQQLVYLRYLLRILPFRKAFTRWNTFEENLLQ